MTGYNAKRKMSQDKLDKDDDTQVYADTLLIVYQRGFVDGKRSAQRPWVCLTDEDVRQCSRDVVAGGSENSVDRFAYAIEAKLKEKNDH